MQATEQTATTEIKPLIMPDHGAWQFTDELIARIKKHDASAMTEFYNSNYNIFLGMARKYVWKQKTFCNNYTYEVDDLVQQVYLDLPYYDFSRRLKLYFCIVKGTFYKVNCGGIATSQSKVIKQSLMFSYDASIKGHEDEDSCTYLLDRFKSTQSPYDLLNDEIDRDVKDSEICAFLERSVKDKTELNAIFCKIFTDIKQSEIRGDEYGYFKQCKAASR